MLSLTIKVTAAAAFAQALKIEAQGKYEELWFNAYNANGSLAWPKPQADLESFAVSQYLDEEEYAQSLSFSTPANVGTMVF